MKLKRLLIAALALIVAFSFTACGGETIDDTTIPQETVSETASETEQTTEGVKAADFTIWDDEENEVKLSDLYGKPTVIHFWATWQKGWKTELEFINEIYPEYENEVNFLIIHLTDNDKENMFRAKGHLIENGYTFPAYFDFNQSAAKAYNVKKQHITVFIDSEGNIYEIFKGEMTKPVFKGYIERLLKEEPTD